MTGTDKRRVRPPAVICCGGPWHGVVLRHYPIEEGACWFDYCGNGGTLRGRYTLSASGCFWIWQEASTGSSLTR